MIGDTAQQSSLTRRLPLELHMGDGAGRDDHVKRALAQHLVCNRDIALRARRVSGAHADESGSLTRPAQERGMRPRHSPAAQEAGPFAAGGTFLPSRQTW